jgi:hypothetical protein
MTMNRLFTCDRCWQPSSCDASARFCPHCGAAWTGQGPTPLVLNTPLGTVEVGRQLGEGPTARAYRCTVREVFGGRFVGVAKVGRSATNNSAMATEASALAALAAAPGFASFMPFVPHAAVSFPYADGADAVRQVNVLRYDAQIVDPADLYTLDEVRETYPRGLDPRDVAWMFRRLLYVIGGAHACGRAHGSVLPANVLIEPADHKLVLIGWCNSQPAHAHWQEPQAPLARAWSADWDRQPRSARDADIGFAARTMIYLLNGRADEPRVSATVEPALARFLERCVAGPDVSGSRDAARLLGDFDRVIEALWGPRKFRPFAMPPRG